MPRYPGFCGPSYTSQARTANAERAMNWYVEQIEAQAAKTQLVLYPTPGTQLFSALSTGPIRGIFYNNGRCFAVGGVNLVELLVNGEAVERGVIANDGLPVSMCDSPDQQGGSGFLLIISAGRGYRLRLSDNNLIDIGLNDPNSGFPSGQASCGVFLDGYFIVLKQESRTFFISELFNPDLWEPLEFATSSTNSDNFISMLVDHGELWLFGGRSAQPYYDSGDANFPFTANLAARIEQGCAAKNSVARLDNTIFWLGGDERGNGIVWRADGYTPKRISNHAVELAIQGLGQEELASVVCYAYQKLGHSFYVMYFPRQNMTWVYDCATNLWHQRGFWNTATGAYEAHHSQCHAFAFGVKHLVGDWNSGNIYEMDEAINLDNGQLIRRERIPPNSIFDQNKRITLHQLEVYLDAGLGLDGGVQGSDPQVMLRMSQDSGYTWSNETSVSAGKIGEFGHRSIFRRLGQGRSLLPKIAVSDPIPWRLVDCFYMGEVDKS